MELELELKNLDEEYQSLSLKREAINKRRNEVKRELLLKKYFDNEGISIGDDVIFEKERAKVDSADSDYLYVKKYKKDGSLYLNPTRVWRFDKLQKINPPC